MSEERCPTCGKRMEKRVDNTKLRQAFIDAQAVTKGELTAELVCERLGWKDASGRHQTSRLMRALGLLEVTDRSEPGYRTKINYDTAVTIADGLNLDPWEVGL